MGEEREHDFAMEFRLRALDPDLHRRFTSAVFGLQSILSNYKLLFPEFTDHTELHSLTVVDFCNRLIGDQIERMNADEIYVLLAGCYFHDTGMGISRKDYDAFSREIDFGDYFETHNREDIPRVIRDFHNEFSGRFIRKYAPMFDIPSDAHLRAIIQVSRGHRKTSLMDEGAYPLALPMPSGNTVCMPYIAALIRLADEIDVAAARNSALLFDIGGVTDETSITEHLKHQAIRDLVFSRDAFTMLVNTQDPKLMDDIRQMAVKMQKTLDDCRQAVQSRTPYTITQEKILIREE